MVAIETVPQTDFLKDNADNIWFVLGAYVLAFFPWMVMHEFDFISEKWRTCRRTRTLARRHIASSIIPIIYVALYAEAQRRAEDNKKLGAALAALMFNVFQLMRSIMGLVQLNAFVAWCKHAVECLEVLKDTENESDSWSASENMEGSHASEKGAMSERVWRWPMKFVPWCRHGVQPTNDDEGSSEVSVNGHRDDVDDPEANVSAASGLREENWDTDADVNAEVNVQVVESNAGRSDRDEASNTRSREQSDIVPVNVPRENAIGSWWKRLSEHMGRREMDGNNIEDAIMVNNMVVDNELGGREVTVLPSWEKIWRGVKEGPFSPSKMLRTDRVILNTIRWGGAYLCGMGEDWSAQKRKLHAKWGDGGEILQLFFSREMDHLRGSLSAVEWDMNVENDDPKFISTFAITLPSGRVDLAAEPITAYGDGEIQYWETNTFTTEAYSFEFNSLVSSYPTADKRIYEGSNRERIEVGLVHSVLLAKWLGVERLKAIRCYYDRNRLAEGRILGTAFKLLLMQTKTRISDDSRIWEMFDNFRYQIPIFPYRMQMVALWDQATNWRVLQASAHRDIELSSYRIIDFEFDNKDKQRVLSEVSHPADIFDFFAKCTFEQLEEEFNSAFEKGTLGVVLETVRSFLVEWISGSTWEPNWEPEVPAATANIEFHTEKGLQAHESDLNWICQRELQREVAEMSMDEGNLPASAALIMLFILGFPLLDVYQIQDDDFSSQNSREVVHDASASSSSNTHCSINLDGLVYRAWTPLSPQDISLIIRHDIGGGTTSLHLQNDSGDERFIWQDWVEAAMGFMKGFEDWKNGELGYGRRIVKPNLGKPMVEVCPLHVDDDGIEPVVEKTSTVRFWTGWPAFDLKICKFEVDQWLSACNIDYGNWQADEVIACAERVIGEIISAENDEVEAPAQSGDA